MAAIQALQQWCKQQCQGYKDVQITNMTTSFRDGLAFCAILHRHRPDLINFNSLSKENVFENNQLAFQVAEAELGIPALLDAEDMVALKVPDRLSILTYVSQYYNYFHGRNPIGGLSGVKRPPSNPGEELTGKKPASEPPRPEPPQPSKVCIASEPKTSPVLQGRNLVKEYPPTTAKRVLAESSNTRSSNCAICGSHVHLVQRHLVDGKLYHRNCFRCKECSGTLLHGSYKSGTQPGTFVCTRHQEPSYLQNSLPVKAKAVGEENKPLSTVAASGSYLKGPESKKLVLDSGKTSPALTTNPTKLDIWSKPSNNKSSSITTSPNLRRSDPTGGKPDLHERTPAPPAPSPWTESSAKTQQARAKFFQSSLGTSGGLPADKTETVKNQDSPLNPPLASGKTTFPAGIKVTEKSSGSNEKDKARNILMHALPGSQTATAKSGGVHSASPSPLLPSTCRSPPPTAGLQHLGTKQDIPARNVTRPTGELARVEKLEQTSFKPGVRKIGGETTTEDSVLGGKPTCKASDRPHKMEPKIFIFKGVTATEEKSESPADWRTRLKPVGNTVSNQSDARTPLKPTHKVAVNIDLSPAQKESKPAASVTFPVTQNTASTADQPQMKKLLKPNLDLLSSWQKPQQQWADLPAARKVEETAPSKKVVAPVKPSAPRTTTKLPNDPVVSPSKLHPDYIPEEEIQKEVRQIERDLDSLEVKGVAMEKQLRSCEGDDSEDALMADWFRLIHEKQLLLRRESELMYKLKQQKLEEKQCNTEAELRNLMKKSDFLKTPKEKAREEELLKIYLAIVNDRNDIVECLDGDRIRELEEDEMVAAMIQKFAPAGHHNNQENDKKKPKFSLFKFLQPLKAKD